MTVHVATVTPSQRDVIRELACDGPSNAEIGDRLGIREDTVKTHMRAALEATGCPNRTALALAVVRGRVRLHVEDHRGDHLRRPA